MKNFLFLITLVLVIAWIIGVFVFNASYLIHILLVLAIAAILLYVTRSMEFN